MAFSRSLLFALTFYLGSAVIVITGALVALVRPSSIWTTTRIWADYFWLMVHTVLGIRVAIEGDVPTGGVIVASKHQSAFETIALLHVFNRPAPVLKAELMKIPLWGYLSRIYGSIPVDREGSGAAMRTMMRAAKDAIAAGRPIVIFPEGSRVPYGTAPELKAGVAGLYKMLRVPVVPLALDSGRLWPRKSFIKRPGTITLSFGETIPPGLDRDTFEARLHAAINRPL